MKKAIFFLLCSVLVSCATTHAPVFPEPEPNKGLMVFYRNTWDFLGMPLIIHDGDKKIRNIMSGTYFFYFAEAGDHTFWIQTEKKASIFLKIQANETYYMRCETGLGILLPRARLTTVSETEGSYAIQELIHVDKMKPADADR